jgi:hypothetical protein
LRVPARKTADSAGVYTLSGRRPKLLIRRRDDRSSQWTSPSMRIISRTLE